MTKTIARTILIAAAVAAMGAAVAPAGDDADAPGIGQAAPDYVNAICEMKPGLLDRSGGPRLQKVGYMPAQDGSGLEESGMTFAGPEDLAGHLNGNGRFDPAPAPEKASRTPRNRVSWAPSWTTSVADRMGAA